MLSSELHIKLCKGDARRKCRLELWPLLVLCRESTQTQTHTNDLCCFECPEMQHQRVSSRVSCFPISWAVEMRHLFMNASLNTVQLGLSSVALMHRFVTAASVSHGRVSCHSWADVWGGGSLRYTAHVNLDFHGLQLSSSICVSMSEADSDRSTTGMIRVPVQISWLNDNAPVSVWMAEVNNMSQSTIFLAGLVRVAADRRYKVDFWCGLI